MATPKVTIVLVSKLLNDLEIVSPVPSLEITVFFFSVIIPCYNRDDRIGATLDSVLGQNMDDLEIIVVDDGSTDGSLDLLRCYGDCYGDRFTVIEQQNAGPGVARNRGVAAARGRYVAFLDSDDLWMRWTAALYRQVLEEQKFPAFLAGMPHATSDPASYKRRADALDWRSAVEVERFADYFASASHWRCWVSASALVVRRDVLQTPDDQSGGIAYTTLPVNGEDIDFSLQLGTAPGFVALAAPLSFVYRRHATSLVANSARTLEGMRNLIRGERTGRYPGGAARARERQFLLGKNIRPVCLALRKAGLHEAAGELYRALLPWNLAQKRVRFLLGFWLLRPQKPARKLEPSQPLEPPQPVAAQNASLPQRSGRD